MLKTVIICIGLLLGAVHTVAGAEVVKVAVPERGEWNTSFTQLGVQQGFFQQQGLVVEIVHVANESSLEKALISGDADVAVAARFPDILAAWINGAQIKIIHPKRPARPTSFGFPEPVAPYAAWLICMPNQLAMASRPH